MEHTADYRGAVSRPRNRKTSLQKYIYKAILAWLMFLPLAFLNGAAREILYRHIVGELRAHQISCVIASLAFVALAYLVLHNNIRNLSRKVLWMTGALWVLTTMVFEFILGYYINRVSWDTLFMDYNVFEGRLWVLVLLTIFVTPNIIKTIKERVHR